MESTDCNLVSSEILVSGSISLIWLVSLVLWNKNSRSHNQIYVKPLHKIIEATVMLKFFQCFFSFISQLFCEPSNISQFFNLAEDCIFALFNTFLFVTFLLISKGFCYTREYLDREDLNVLIIATGGIYISFCIYLMQAEWSILVIVICVSMIWMNINKNLKEMIAALETKIEMMRRNNLNNSLQAAKTKLSMASRVSNIFQVFMVIYVFSYLWLGYMRVIDDYSHLLVCIAISEVNEIISVIAVCFIFYPKYNGQFFDLAEYENAEENRVLEMHETDGKGLDDLLEDNQVFLSKQPFGEIGNYYDYLVAMPISLHYHQDIPNHLEPLLADNSK